MNYRLASTAHFLTIDVVDWHRDPAIPAIERARHAGVAAERAGRLVADMIDLLARTNARATFFVEEGVARREPRLVRAITSSGNEVAAHGDYAGPDWEAFRADARRVKEALEDAAGIQVRGFRSPGSDLTASGSTWRYEQLVDAGYDYVSSRVAAPHEAGRGDYPRTVLCGAGSLLELPRLAHPIGSSALSFRHAPYAAIHREFAARSLCRVPAVASVATWEIDEEQPRVKLPMVSSVRHYAGRRLARERVGLLLRDFRFDAIGHRLGELAQSAPTAFAA